MVHDFNSRRNFGKHKSGVNPQHTGKHKKNLLNEMFEEAKEEAMSPSKNVEEFYKMVMEDYVDEEKKKKYEAGELSDEEMEETLRDAIDGAISDDEAEPIATVFYGNDDTPHTVGQYHDDTEGDFDAKWKSTDAWRGYYEVEPSEKWVNVHSDTILSMSEDAEELEDFDEKLREELDSEGIPYARVFTRTSNVFSTGYDFFVDRQFVSRVNKLVEKLKKQHRDPERFTATALTGADPSEMTEADKKFVKASKRLMGGETFEKVKKDIEEGNI